LLGCSAVEAIGTSVFVLIGVSASGFWSIGTKAT
jgi:hypothetical protein